MSTKLTDQLPGTNGGAKLGSSTLRWSAAWVQTLDVSGNTTLTGTVGIGVAAASAAAKLQVGDGTAGTAALYIRAFGGSTGGDMYLGQSGGSVYGTAAGASGLLLQNAAAPLGLGTLQAQPIYIGTGGSGTANVRLGIGATGDIAINKGIAAAQAKLELAGGTFALTDSGNSWLSSKFDSQGVARNTLTSPSVVLNGGSTDRPEIAFYRGARTYPEFVLRENTTADSGGEIWVGNGQAVPIKTVTFNSSVVGILSPTTQLGAGDNSAAPGNSVLRGSDGTGTNISGASITIQPGRGTGSGVPGPGFLGAAKAGTTGTTLQTSSNVVKWTAAGFAVIGNQAALGYGPGAGASVVQFTTKSTAVTINAGTGQITTPADALAAGAVATFTMTNSVIGQYDNVVVQRASGGTAGAYRVWCDSVAAGSCTVCIENHSAGSLSEALTLSFKVLSGAIA